MKKPKEVKILGEDRCHILLVKVVLEKAKIKGIKPIKLQCKGAGCVLKKLKKQLESSNYYYGEVAILDYDRNEIEVPKIQRIKNKFKWDIYLMILEPNCEGFILKWMGEKFDNPKERFKAISCDYDSRNSDAFIRYAVERLVKWENVPDSIQKLLEFLHRIRNL